MTDVLSKLPRLSWRGIVVPILGGRTASFSHEDVRHKFLYQDNELVESLGAQAWTFSYTIPFRQDIARGPYRNLYTETLPQFIVACRDRSPGELVDPELGLFRAKPTQFTSEIDVNKRDGSDIKVEFVHSPELADFDTLEVPGTLSSAESQAGQLDAQVALVDWEQEEPPPATVDPFSAIDGIGRQIEFQANKVSNKLDDAAFRLEKLEKTVDRLENPQVWPLKRSARRLRGAVLRMKERADNGDRIIAVLNNYDRTLTSIAAETGMTLQQLLQLNPHLAGMPMVPRGVSYRRRRRVAA